eukprot:jgi/Botrbrau1/10541/Bobra.7_1s0019.1
MDSSQFPIAGPPPMNDLMDDFGAACTLTNSRSFDNDVPRTPERQGIPEALHPPPVRRSPLMCIARRFGDVAAAKRRLDFGDEVCEPDHCTSSQTATHIKKRARSVEVTSCGPRYSSLQQKRVKQSRSSLRFRMR